MRKPTYLEALLTLNTVFMAIMAWSLYQLATWGIDISGYVDSDASKIESALEHIDSSLDAIQSAIINLNR